MIARIHRFHGKVAVWIGGESTCYLTPATARQLSDAIDRCALDIEARSFVDSDFTVVEIEEEPQA